MGYLEDFQTRINRDDYQGFLLLWEEYCSHDAPEGSELVSVLEMVKSSRFAGRFGILAETALSLHEKVADDKLQFDALRLIFDLQSTNSPHLAELAFRSLKDHYGQDQYFAEKTRLIGLRNGDSFQGAIRNYELLTHVEKGAFVYHTGGWGTGEVVDISLVREELVLEFEAVGGRKSLSFENAFSNLIKLDGNHFYSRRFGDPDKLEAEARKDPVAVIRDLLKDLGPKTAGEIKEELCELVIPQEDWTKWWQAARSRIKKDTRIDTPKSLREPFVLREEALSHADRMKRMLSELKEPDRVLLTVYNFVRDFPEVLRSQESRDFMKSKVLELLAQDQLELHQRLQIAALMEEFFEETMEPSLAELVKGIESLPDAIEKIGIAAFKKKVLISVRENRSEWGELFLEVLFRQQQSTLRDYLVRELVVPEMMPKFEERVQDLMEAPIRQPHLFVWLFQKVIARAEGIPYGEEKFVYQWFEAFLTLFHQLDYVPELRELSKKMFNILTAKRYSMVRELLKDSPVEFAQEFLLLQSKCHGLSIHDHKIMQSLAEVVHPSLAGTRKEEEVEEEGVIWTTREGYDKIRQRIEQIGTVETVDNAKEIESAREHGDLRENAEYKAALERRSRLQAELKMLSDQLNQARILTPDDVSNDVTGVGSIVELLDAEGKIKEYTLLGPWDADPDQHILSYQSKLARAVMGLKIGDDFTYQDKKYSVKGISNYFKIAR